MLLKSLVVIGAIAGVTVGTVGTIVPWLFPSLFTNDQMVVQQVRQTALVFYAFWKYFDMEIAPQSSMSVVYVDVVSTFYMDCPLCHQYASYPM
jgi:hypothetical protein